MAGSHHSRKGWSRCSGDINLRLVLSGGAAIVVALITAFAQPAVGAARTPTKINAPTKFVVALFLSIMDT